LGDREKQRHFDGITGDLGQPFPRHESDPRWLLMVQIDQKRNGDKKSGYFPEISFDPGTYYPRFRY
jgi:hypothetical protein